MGNIIMDQIFWERYAAAATVSQLNPSISEVRITISITGKEPVSITLTPDSKYMMRVDCPKRDCDNGHIDLSDEIFNAVKLGKSVEGRKKCPGHLKKYNHNRSIAFDCETYVKYKIEPVLKSDPS